MDGEMMHELVNMPLGELMNEADRLRQKQFGQQIELCGIVNAKSGACAMDCRFCAQSRHHATQSETYPLRDETTLHQETTALWQCGVKRVGWVMSGCTVEAGDLEDVVHAASTLQSKSLSLHAKSLRGGICASMGQLNTDSFKRLKVSGITRYHHNLETSERFYPAICTTQRWQDRLATAERAKEIGLEICCGGLFGLGETWDDRIALAETLRKLDVDSVPINFFHPIPGTPLADITPLVADEALRIIAVFRILLPTTSLRICGGRPTILGERQPEMVRAGTDALMTGHYLTTSGISPQTDHRWLTQLGCRIG